MLFLCMHEAVSLCDRLGSPLFGFLDCCLGSGILYRCQVYLPHFLLCLYILQVVRFYSKLEYEVFRLS